MYSRCSVKNNITAFSETAGDNKKTLRSFGHVEVVLVP